MDPARIDATLSLLTPDEVGDCLWLIDVFERWNMTTEEADEWRRRIAARWAFLDLPEDPGLVS